MIEEQLLRMKNDPGFIAALDQSGGSTPKALLGYGIGADRYHNEEEMFQLVHEMRARVILSPAFSNAYILGAILFERTMDSQIKGKFTADYLWEEKGIVPFLKVDQGLEPEQRGVQLMKPMPGLDKLLERAVERHIFGTKMRSVIKSYQPEGIKKVVEQQFAVGKIIAGYGLVPILEPEVDIHSENRQASEKVLKEEIFKGLDAWPVNTPIMLKVSIPEIPDFYQDLIHDPRMLRVVALSGGYDRKVANEKLALNHGLIASFSRALLEGLSDGQTEDAFNLALGETVQEIFRASAT